MYSYRRDGCGKSRRDFWNGREKRRCKICNDRSKVRQGSVTRWKFRSDGVKMAHGGKFTRLKREYARERTADTLKIMRYVLLIRVSSICVECFTVKSKSLSIIFLHKFVSYQTMNLNFSKIFLLFYRSRFDISTT